MPISGHYILPEKNVETSFIMFSFFCIIDSDHFAKMFY